MKYLGAEFKNIKKSKFMIVPNKIYSTILFLFFLNNLLAQELTINETIDYINKKLVESSSMLDQISITNDGYIRIIRTTSKNDPSYKSFEFTKSFHYTEIGKAFIDQRGTVDISCKGFKNCVKTVGYYPGWSIGTNLSTGDNYTNQKICNALNYLFDKVAESPNYKRDDTDDPFNPSNFGKDKITGKDTKCIIPLIENDGVYSLITSIESHNISFILDSGASETSISSSTERRLINDGIIKQTSYLTPGLYKLANGSIVEARRLMLSELTIGCYQIQNISVSVQSDNAPMLLGRNILDKFKKWSIDNVNSKLILEKY